LLLRSTDTTKNEDADAGTTEKPEPEAAEAGSDLAATEAFNNG
jgi:hypothetical protein